MKLHSLLYPVQALDEELRFFERGLGLTVKFRDGARYAALDGAALPIALAAAEERVAAQAAAVFRVADVPQAVALLLAAGATLLRPAERGPHEWRAVVASPNGHPLILTAKL
ncbi:MAG: VOC family protein [Nevskiaceae bacterium]|nr:MAG: VOC family protein [Nevskiaceae bacterium]